MERQPELVRAECKEPRDLDARPAAPGPERADASPSASIGTRMRGDRRGAAEIRSWARSHRAGLTGRAGPGCRLPIRGSAHRVGVADHPLRPARDGHPRAVEAGVGSEPPDDRLDGLLELR